jgi:riboflavin transporter FmnP
MTAVMVLMNLLLTPLFMMVPREEVIKLLMPAIIPFNLLKAGANSVVTFLAYKPISKRVLHGQSLDRCEKA